MSVLHRFGLRRRCRSKISKVVERKPAPSWSTLEEPVQVQNAQTLMGWQSTVPYPYASHGYLNWAPPYSPPSFTPVSNYGIPSNTTPLPSYAPPNTNHPYVCEMPANEVPKKSVESPTVPPASEIINSTPGPSQRPPSPSALHELDTFGSMAIGKRRSDTSELCSVRRKPLPHQLKLSIPNASELEARPPSHDTSPRNTSPASPCARTETADNRSTVTSDWEGETLHEEDLDGDLVRRIAADLTNLLVRHFLRQVPSQGGAAGGSSSQNASSSRSIDSSNTTNNAPPSTGSHSSSNFSGQKRGRRNTGNGEGSQDNDDSDEEDWDRPKKKKDKTSDASSAHQKRLKCPYFQKEPEKHPRSACRGQGFVDMAKLKDHLKRVHLKPLRCKRCWADMPSEEAHEEHIRQDSVCNKQPKPDDNRISLQRLQDLNFNRAPFAHAQGMEGKWRILYRFLFPEDEIIPSPYEEHGMSALFEKRLADRLREELLQILGPPLASAVKELDEKIPALISEVKESVLGASPDSETFKNLPPARSRGKSRAQDEETRRNMVHEQKHFDDQESTDQCDWTLRKNLEFMSTTAIDLEPPILSGFEAEDNSMLACSYPCYRPPWSSNPVQMFSSHTAKTFDSTFDIGASDRAVHQRAMFDLQAQPQVNATLGHDLIADIDWSTWITPPA